MLDFLVYLHIHMSFQNPRNESWVRAFQHCLWLYNFPDFPFKFLVSFLFVPAGTTALGNYDVSQQPPISLTSNCGIGFFQLSYVTGQNTTRPIKGTLTEVSRTHQILKLLCNVDFERTLDWFRIALPFCGFQDAAFPSY